MEELLKSKAQLIEELNNLRKRVSELETIKKQKEDIEEKFNLFMDHLPGCAFIKDLKGKYLYLNKYYKTFYGFNVEEFIGKTDRQIWDNATAKKFRKNDRLILSELEQIQSIDTIITDYVKRDWLSYKFLLIKDKKPQYIAGMAFEITEQQRLLKELQNSEERFRKIVENAPIGIYYNDFKGNFLYGNKKAEEIIGYRTKELVGRNMLKVGLLKGTDLVKAAKILAKNIMGKASGPDIFTLHGKDEKKRVVEIYTEIIQLNDKKVVFGMVLDITGRVASEVALKENEARYRAVVEQSRECIFLVDLQTRKILEANRAFKGMLGYNDDDIDKMTIYDVVAHEKKDIDDKIETIVRKKGHHLGERYYLKKDDVKIPVEARVSLIEYSGKRVMSVVSMDISERKKAEAEKMKLQQHLQQIQKMEALGTLAGGIAHDFNNALTAVTGNIELIKIVMPENEKIQRFSSSILEATTRMVHLTGQLLAYARGGKYNAIPLSLDDFIKENLSILKHSIPADIILDIKLNCQDKIIMSDPGQLMMIFLSILNNSVEAINDRGKVIINTELLTIDKNRVKEKPCLNLGSYIKISITDNGCGMDKKTLERIFEPFFTTNFQGRGLGMAAVYGITKNHNGCIYVNSEVGKGTTVNIYLPVTKEMIIEKKQIMEKQVKGSGTILIIEDEEYVRETLKEMLKNLDYRLLTAKDAKEALQIAKTYNENIDVALLDMGLPDMPGHKLYPFLKKARPNIKVIICSGYSKEGAAQDLLDLGAEGFLPKPFSFSALANTLAKVISDD